MIYSRIIYSYMTDSQDGLIYSGNTYSGDTDNGDMIDRLTHDGLKHN